ncbi:MAG: glycosyltransferase family 1 protein, partial [Bacteroidetes bacterium]|nr:glycosyltransferase family 1 protein [Bacteroidota bacterium]
EAAYRADLGASRFGITTRRAGWDCLRHYEIAASGTIPCFRDLHRKPPRCAPHGLVDGLNCLSYSSGDQLLARINRLSPAQEAKLQTEALAWARASSTKQRAMVLLSLAELKERTYG